MALRLLDLSLYLRVDSPIPHDVRFLVEDPVNPNIRVEITGHKFLLALISPVFQAQFYGQIRMGGDTVVVQDCDPWSFQHLINFIYSSSIENFQLVESDATELVTIQKLFNLIKTADRFMISSLVNLCNKSIRDVPINQRNVFLLASSAENINHIDILSRDIFYKCGVFIRNTILFDATFVERVSEEDRQVFELLAGMDILDAHLAIRTNATTGIAQTSASTPNNSVGISQTSSKDKDKNENVEDKDDNSNNLDNHIIQNSTVHEDAIDIDPDSANSIVDADASSQNEENVSVGWIDKFKEMVNNTSDSKEMANHAMNSQDSGEDSNISNADNSHDGHLHFTKTKINQDASDAGDPKEDTGDPKQDSSGGPVEKIIDTSTNNFASAINAEDSSLDGDSVGITSAAINSVNEATEARRLVPCVSENQVIQVESLAYYRATKWKRLNARTEGSAGPPSVEYGKMLRPPYHLMSLLRFKAGAAKGYSFTDKNTMIFVVLRGELVVTIHETDITVKKGDCFYVPTKNGYNIVNEGEATAELALVQYQYDGPLPQGQLLG